MVPRLNIILDLICRQYFSERNSVAGAPQFVLPVIGGIDNEMCQIPEVGWWLGGREGMGADAEG